MRWAKRSLRPRASVQNTPDASLPDVFLPSTKDCSGVDFLMKLFMILDNEDHPQVDEGPP